MRDTAREDALQDAFWGNNQMTAGSWFFPCTVRKYYTFCTFYLHSRLPSLHMEEFDSARLSESHVCTKDLFTPIFWSLGVSRPPRSIHVLPAISRDRGSHPWLSSLTPYIGKAWRYFYWLSLKDVTNALKSCRMLISRTQGLYFTFVIQVW